jgi:hypothetical protein
MEFANRHLRSGLCHAHSAFSVSHCFAGFADDFTFTQLHTADCVGFHGFDRSISLHRNV